MSGLCKMCGLCCRLIPVDVENRKLLRDGVQPLDETFANQLLPVSYEQLQNDNDEYIKNVLKIYPQAEFFRCKYLVDDNLCTSLDKPEICVDFPIKPFAFIHDECGYVGEQFLKIEMQKQKIRKIKEEIIHYEALVATFNNKKDIESYLKIIHVHQRYIEKYTAWGALDW